MAALIDRPTATTTSRARCLRLLIALAGGIAGALAVFATPAVAAPAADGDFNGDGYGDLAVGAPEDSVRGQQAAGAVNVLYGSAHGLRSAGNQESTISGVPQPGARFGAALAAGDIDADGFSDLAIGVPGEGLGDQPAAGAVIVLYGSASGLHRRARVGSWNQDSHGVKAHAEAGDRFGTALALGDVDGDGFGDLAVGAPGDSVGGRANAGAVNLLYGGPGGLTAVRNQLWTQASEGIKGIAGSGHTFGAALAAGDMSADGRADLAIGIPGGVIHGNAAAGAVSVLYGREGGLSSVDDLWSQDAVGIAGVAERNDRFGQALAIGDFDADGTGDLAVGAPIEGVGNAVGAGAVNVVYGSRSGLHATGDQIWSQRSPGVHSRASIGETFGSALVAADFSRDGTDDLAIGVPGEQVGGDVNAGAVAVLYGDEDRGLSQRANRVWNQDTRGVKGHAEASDRFGAALAAGDFNGDRAFDLAIGVPSERVGGFIDGGAVSVLYGSGSGVQARDQLWSQATPGIEGAPGNDRFGSALVARVG